MIDSAIVSPVRAAISQKSNSSLLLRSKIYTIQSGSS